MFDHAVWRAGLAGLLVTGVLACGDDSEPEPLSVPSPRTGHAMVYDSMRERIVLFGGSAETGAAETWEWDGELWHQLFHHTLPPPTLAATAMAYDEARGVAVVFGGDGLGAVRADTWTWDGERWEDRTSIDDGPSPRAGHALAYDSRREVVVLFGGETSGALAGDTWEWNGESWSQVTPEGSIAPPARAGHSMVFDAARGVVVLFGGLSGEPTGEPRPAETWQWDGTRWTDVTPADGGPSERTAQAMTYDTTRNVVVMFGGFSDSGHLAETWEWNGTSWSESAPAAAPAPRLSPALAYHAGKQVSVLFGGSSLGDTGALRLSDTWLWDGASWVDTEAGAQ